MTAKLIRSMPELLEAIRARRDELGVTHENLDSISGLASGYVSKLLCDPPMKGLGATSLPALLGALGAALVMVPDTAQIERVSPRWQKRKRPQRLPTPADRQSLAVSEPE